MKRTNLSPDCQLTNNDVPASAALRLERVRRNAPSVTITAWAALIVALMCGSPFAGSAQTLGGSSEVFAGSEFESYLRYLQTLGKSKPTVWSMRGLSPLEVDALAPTDSRHPWAARYSFGKRAGTGPQLDFIRPTVGFIANTSYPFGSNDGALWAGKGLTSWAQLGVSARWGPLSARVAPIAFRAENAAFPLMENGQTGRLAYADGQFYDALDKPQRFGDSPYSRVDLGESMLRVDFLGIGAGVSTENQWWGPTVEFPYVLGNNAGGFPHAFVGTSRPAPIGFGHIHGRVVYGYLGQSDYSSVTGPDYFRSYDFPGTTRLMAGLTGLLQINGIPGLEFGGSRFFHSARDSTGFTSHDLGLPFQNLLKGRLKAEGDTAFGDDRSILENQQASIYFRWAPPTSGFEMYAEYGREDFSFDVRDFFLEPDHSSTINIGFRKAWLKDGGNTINAFRTEFFTYEAPAGTRSRGEGLFYLHQPLRQGHTLRGQMLGAPTGAGSGSAQMFAFERYVTTGRMKAYLSRVTQREYAATKPAYTSGPPIVNPIDAQLSIGGEVSRFIGSFDVTGRLVLTSEANRYFLNDKSNASLALILRQGF